MSIMLEEGGGGLPIKSCSKLLGVWGALLAILTALFKDSNPLLEGVVTGWGSMLPIRSSISELRGVEVGGGRGVEGVMSMSPKMSMRTL